MTALVRTKSGSLTLDDSYTLKDIENNDFKCLSVLELLDKNKTFEIKESLLRFVLNGREIYLPYNQIKTGDFIYLSYENRLIAIYEKQENGKYKAKRVWK